MPTANEWQQVIGTTSGGFIGIDQKRIGLIITPGLANRFTISLKGTAILDQGITIYPGLLPFRLNLLEDGAVVQQSWQAISAVAAQTITVIEIFP